MQIRTLKLLANVNTENDDNNKVIVENNVSPILKERKKPSTVTMNIYIAMTSSIGTDCSWQFNAVIRNASRGSFDISSYNIDKIFLSGIVLSFVLFFRSFN